MCTGMNILCVFAWQMYFLYDSSLKNNHLHSKSIAIIVITWLAVEKGTVHKTEQRTQKGTAPPRNTLFEQKPFITLITQVEQSATPEAAWVEQNCKNVG